MDDLDSTRRTVLKVLGVGAAGAASTGLVTAGEYDDDDADETKDKRRLYVAELGPQKDVKTDAVGAAAFQLRAGKLTFALAVANIEDTFMTHIHEDEVLGPIAVWLHNFETQDQEPVEGRFTGLLDAGTITDDVIQKGRVEEAKSETVDDLVAKIEAGEAFVNVHTEAFPDGELAGRIERLDLSKLATEYDEYL